MKKYSSVALSILTLSGVIIGASLWLRIFYSSIQNYRSPLQGVNLPLQPAPPAQTDRVVIVLLEGLGYDAARTLNLPALEQLQKAGAAFAVQSMPPTYSQTAWATLVTGASPELNDAPPIDLPREQLHPLAIDTIFARAAEAGLQTALLGPAEWERMLPPGQLSYTHFAPQSGPDADRDTLRAALTLLENTPPNLTLIHFTQLNIATLQEEDAETNAYQQAASTLDNYLEQIGDALDLSQNVLIVLSDHGQLPDGGYGGNDVEVIWQPLVAIGQNIIPGDYSDIHQTDIAPTIAALLGLPFPTAAQGRVLFEMFRQPELDQAVAQISLARQRVALVDSYLKRIIGPSASLSNQIAADLEQAHQAFRNRNINGALTLARLVQQEADSQMHAARLNRLKQEQWPRLGAVTLVSLLWLILMWRRRSRHAGLIIIAAIVTVSMFHTLYQLQGYGYTLSAITSFTEWPFDVARHTAAAMLVGGGVLLALLLFTGEENWLIILGVGYGFGVLATFAFAAPLFWAFWQNGLDVAWRLPDASPAFWQTLSLFAVMTSASFGLLLPWPIMALNLFVNLVHHIFSESRANQEDVLPGLHL